MSFDGVYPISWGLNYYFCPINIPLVVLLIVTCLAILQISRKKSNDWAQIFQGINGKVEFNVPLSGYTRFRTGGVAQFIFHPSSIKELQYVLRKLSPKVPVTVIGFGSNVLIRDGGISGVVIKLSHSVFRQISINTSTFQVWVGAGFSQHKFAKLCAYKGIGNLEFFCGIPGSIGGALRMNAGAHGKEVSNCLLTCEVMDRAGVIHVLTVDELKYSYRHCGTVPQDWIFISATFQGEPDSSSVIKQKIEKMMDYRENCQPVNDRTAGCTFTNPSSNVPAWKLITQAGLQGMTHGHAQVSNKHANFLINLGNANSKQIEDLGDLIVDQVEKETGITLNWEVIRLGNP